jgi:site-specific DNA recombinase
MLLRVSTPGQARDDKYGLAAQEKEIREKLIVPLGLQLDEERHIIRDTYTGLEFKERPVLIQVLNMAKRGEFDVVTMDVLDRLGRKGLERELYRMQLREQGVRILTTDPNEHADDDSLVGEMIRYFSGIQSEKELHNTRRRTTLGKRAKAEGRRRDGTIGPRKVVGTGERIYAYKYVLNEKGRREGYELNLDAIIVDGVVLMDEDSTEWTEVKVVVFVFDKVIEGIPYKQIADMLNKKGIPCPYVAKGLAKKTVRHVPLWQRHSVSRMIHQSAYWGEYRQFRTQRIGKVRGKKDPRRKTSLEEQVIIPVPAIVSKETAEKAQQRALRSKALASRNNKHKEDNLLSGGLIKCGYCGHNMYARRDYRRTPGTPWFIY